MYRRRTTGSVDLGHQIAPSKFSVGVLDCACDPSLSIPYQVDLSLDLGWPVSYRLPRHQRETDTSARDVIGIATCFCSTTCICYARISQFSNYIVPFFQIHLGGDFLFDR